MTDATKVPHRGQHREKVGNPVTDEWPVFDQVGASKPDNPAWRVKRPSPWPYQPGDSSALTWWRKLPSDMFGIAERYLVLETLKHVSVLHADESTVAALDGNATAAIGVAFSFMPIEEISLPADIAMTALLRCALDRNAAAALVLTQVLGLTNLGHPFAKELSASWYTHGLRYSSDPRKFREAETILLATFRERDKDG